MVVLTLMLLSALAGSPASDEEASAAIEDFAWMAGHWRGEGFGGQVEEVWSEPLAGTMMGTFRLVKDGRVSFYEIMVLEPDAAGIVLRVKHFSEDFTAWEDKAHSVDFHLEKLEGQTATFDGLTLSRQEDAFEVRIRMRRKDGSTRWETLAMQASRP